MNIRLNEVRKYIENHGEATVETLTELLGCSKMTVWRYLKQLEDEGSIRRVRNGAIATSLAGDTEGLYSQRMHENADAKLSIARAAIPYLVPNTSIFLDAGTTVMSLVRQLPNQHYTIVTSGANIAIELSQRSKSTVSCVGGQISSSSLSLSGPQAEAFLATVNIDTAVLAATGYSAGAGFTVGSYTENSLKRRVIQKADKVILLIDRSKLGRTLPFPFASLSDIDVVICDAPLPEDFIQAARAAGTEVLQVQPAK